MAQSLGNDNDYVHEFYVHAKLNMNRTLDFVLKWQHEVVVDILCIFLQDTITKDSATIFLSPFQREFYSTLNFSTEHSNCLIKVYGLSTRESPNGRFYQLSGFCKRELQVEDFRVLLDSCLYFEIQETLVTDLPLKQQENGAEKLDVTILRSPPANYTVVSTNAFSETVTFIIFLKQITNMCVFVLHTSDLRLSLPLALESGTWVDIQVICSSQSENQINKSMITRTISHTSKTFKTYLSTKDYNQLYTLALAFIHDKKSKAIHSKMKPIQHFYRNKSEQYFKDIMESKGGIMYPYAKDFNGDQGSLINGALNGIFFSSYLSRSKPPPDSYYGPIRLHVKANVIFEDSCNVYFSDFYCHYEKHYVTVVLTKQGSAEDSFCKYFLLQMNKYENPFLKLIKNEQGRNSIMANMALVVEVFYTESVDVGHILKQGHGYMGESGILGRGESKKHGIPKNENCKLCNLSFWR